MTAALEMALDLRVRWRGGELDRLLDQDHADLGNSVSAALNGLGWSVRPEVSFSVYGERGVIDVLAWRPNTGALLVIELKTSIPDLQNLLATLDRKARLAPTVASRIGWQSRGVSAVVILAAGRTNRARVARHRSVLEAALPADGRTVRAWLRRPAGEIRGLTYWPISHPVRTTAARGAQYRVRLPRRLPG